MRPTGMLSAPASGFGLGAAAMLAPYYLFVAPAAGWLHPEAPIFGRSADTTPLERPG
jgi:hypothetical protein